MDRINGAGHVGRRFVAEDADLGRPPTLITDAWLNSVQEEIVNVILAAGGTLDGGQEDQLLQAINDLIQAASNAFVSVGGTADAITATYAPVVAALTNGMTVYVRADLANATATPTFTPASGVIAAKTIVKGAGAALVAGDVAGAGHWIELQYDATLDKWVLQNPAKGVSISVNMASSATTQGGLSTTESVTPKGLADTMLAGVGATINNPAGRALATNYINSTGRPIFVSISIIAAQGVNVTLTGTADGKIFGPVQGYSPSGAIALSIAMVVMPGQAFRADIAGPASLTNWTEVS